MVGKPKWMEERVIKMWSFHKPITWWFRVIKGRGVVVMQLMLRAKVFIRRVMVGVYHGGMRRTKETLIGMLFFCLVELEHKRHRFLSWSMAMMG